MIGWIRKRLAAKPALPKQSPARAASPENCALWNDVMRALDAKPRTSK